MPSEPLTARIVDSPLPATIAAPDTPAQPPQIPLLETMSTDELNQWARNGGDVDAYLAQRHAAGLPNDSFTQEERDKLAEARLEQLHRGVSVGGAAKAAVKGFFPTLGGLIKGAVNTGTDLATATTSVFPVEARVNALKNLGASVEKGGKDFVDLGRTGFHKYVNNPLGLRKLVTGQTDAGSQLDTLRNPDADPAAKQKILDESFLQAQTELGNFIAGQDIAEGKGALSGVLPGKTDPARVESEAAVTNPANFIPGAVAGKVLGAASDAARLGELAGATGLRKLAIKSMTAIGDKVPAAVGATARAIVGAPLKVIAKGAAAIGAKKSLEGGGLGAVISVLGHGEPLTGLAYGVVAPPIARVVAKVASSLGRNLPEAAGAATEGITKNVLLPGATQAAGAGVFSVPFAASEYSDEKAGGMLAGGMAFGGIHGAAHGTGVGIGKSFSDAVRTTYNRPPVPYRPTFTPDETLPDTGALGYTAPELATTMAQWEKESAENATASSTRDPIGGNLINFVRELTRRIVGEDGVARENKTFVVNPDTFKAAKQTGGTSAAGVKNFAYEVADPSAPSGKKQVTVTLLNAGQGGGARSALHENLGHVIQENVLTDAQRQSWYQEIRNTYTPEQIDAWRQYQQALLSAGDAKSPTGESLVPPRIFSEDDAVKEIGAEALASFAGGYDGRDTAPGLKRKGMMIVGGLLEALGTHQPTLGPEGSPNASTLGVGHSFDLASLATEFFQKHNIKLPDEFLSATPEETARVNVNPKSKPADLSIPPILPKNATDKDRKRAEGELLRKHPTVTVSSPDDPAWADVDKRIAELGASPEDAAKLAALKPQFGKVLSVPYEGFEKKTGDPANDLNRRRAGYIAEALGWPTEDLRTRQPYQIVPQSIVVRPIIDKATGNVRANINVQIFSPTEVHINAIRAAEAIKAKGLNVADYFPIEVDADGKITDAGHLQLESALETYTRNQTSGYAGSGQRLTRPPGYEVAIPPEVGKPVDTLPQSMADFVNAMQGIEPPATLRRGKATPANVSAQTLAEVNVRPLLESKFSKPGLYKGETRGIKEMNPWRARVAEQGINLAKVLDETVREVNIENIREPAQPVESKTTGVSSGMIQAGFMPEKNVDVQKSNEDFMRKAGRPYTPHTGYRPVNEELGKRIADFYDTAKHDPTNPEVQASYKALADETIQQWDHAVAGGMKFEPWTGQGEPYKNSTEMTDDVRNNKHLFFLPTGENFAVDHPMLADSGREVDGQKLSVNDVFRAAHDLNGHVPAGLEFGPRGEYNAFLTHAAMYSDEAKPALAAETMAQNSWVNFGKHLRDANGNIPKKGEPGFVEPSARPFAEQKALVLPKDLQNESLGTPAKATLEQPSEIQAAIAPLAESIKGLVDHLKGATEVLPTGKGVAPATFLGTQEGFGTIPAQDLYNLTESIPGHGKDSTVSGNTLRKLGYELPPKPEGGAFMAGYAEDFSKSNNAINAENQDRFPATEIAKRLRVPVGFIKDKAPKTGEWHHTSKFYNTTEYYDLAQVKDWLEGTGDYIPERSEPTGNDKLAEWKMAEKAAKEYGSEIVNGVSIKYIEWSGTRNHPVANEVIEHNVRIERKPGQKMVTITTPEGKVFRKGLETRGFEIGDSEGKFFAAPYGFERAVKAKASPKFMPSKAAEGTEKRDGVTFPNGDKVAARGEPDRNSKLVMGHVGPEDEVTAKLVTRGEDTFFPEHEKVFGRNASDLRFRYVPGDSKIYWSEKPGEVGQQNAEAWIEKKGYGTGLFTHDYVGANVARPEFQMSHFMPAPKLDTPEFKTWFEDSKVVDDKGKPLVVYHGSPTKNFNNFEIPSKGKNSNFLGSWDVSRHAAFFTDSLEEATGYSRQGQKEPGQPRGFYLNLLDPVDLTDPMSQALFNTLVAEGVNERWLSKYSDYGKKWPLFDSENDPEGTFVKALEKLGYDGAKFKEVGPESGQEFTTYAIFRPEQAKIVVNKGSWDPKNSDIHFMPAKTEAGKALEKQGMKFMEHVDGLRHILSLTTDDFGREQVGHIDYQLIKPLNFETSRANPDLAQVNYVNVKPEERRKGLGETLYREMLAYLQEAGITKVQGMAIQAAPIRLREKLLGNVQINRLGTPDASGHSLSDVSSIIPGDAKFMPTLAELEKRWAKEATKPTASKFYDPKDGLTGWILPTGHYHGEKASRNTGDIHGGILTANPDWAKKFGFKVSDDSREAALQAGLARTREEGKVLHVEAAAGKFKKSQKDTVLEMLAADGFVERAEVDLLNEKAKVVRTQTIDKPNFMPAEKIDLDKLPQSGGQDESGYFIMPKGESDPLGNPEGFSHGKFYLSPDNRWISVEHHEDAARAILGKQAPPKSNVYMNPSQAELELNRGFVRVIDQDSVLYFSSKTSPSQLRELKNIAIETQKELIDDSSGKERILYTPESSSFMPSKQNELIGLDIRPLKQTGFGDLFAPLPKPLKGGVDIKAKQSQAAFMAAKNNFPEPDFKRTDRLANQAFRRWARYVQEEGRDEVGVGIFMDGKGKIKFGEMAIGNNGEVEYNDKMEGHILVGQVHTHPLQSAEHSEFDFSEAQKYANQTGREFISYVIGLDDYGESATMSTEIFEPEDKSVHIKTAN